MTTENMTNEQMASVISKIQKLLALAESDNENEAKLALQRAQELQAKYNVVFDQINVEDNKVTEESYQSPDTKTLNSFFCQMAAYLADHYRVRIYIHHFYKDGTPVKDLRVVGLPFDVEVFKQSLYFAYNAMRSLSRSFVRRLPEYWSRSSKAASKNDYCFGFIKGVAEALRENETEKALIVVTPAAVVEYMNKLSLRRGSSLKRASNGDRSAFQAGMSDGRASMKGGSRLLTE